MSIGSIFLGLLAQVGVMHSPGEVAVTRSITQPPTQGPAANFTGVVRVSSRFQAAVPARAGGAVVSFDAGARTAWHTHPLGQTLVVISGNGEVQHWEGPIQKIGVGDTVWIPPGVKHWHGATATDGMTHLAVAEALDGSSVTWMKKVDADQLRGRN